MTRPEQEAGQRQAGERFAVGIDVGTSSVKVSVLTSHGRQAEFVSQPYSTQSEHPGWAEQDPGQWWDAAGQALADALEAFPGIDARSTRLGLTGQMHTSVLRDSTGTLIRPAILWSDTRATSLCAAIEASSPLWESIAGQTPMPAFTSAHLAWLAENEPASLARAHTIAVPKDDLRLRLGAGWATEPSDASAMNLMNYRTDQWASDLIDHVGASHDQLPPILASTEVTGVITNPPPARGRERQLLGIPVVAGAGDQAAQALALQVTDAGALGLGIGTSGVAFRAVAQPVRGAFRHALPETWLALDSTHAAGLALAWWTDRTGIEYSLYDAEPDSRPESLPVFLPYLQGARGGRAYPGTLTGLRATHTSKDLAAAVLEGVAIDLVRLAEGLPGSSGVDDVVRIGGRAGRIAALRQLLADGLGRPVVFSPSGSASGAAILAAHSDGWTPPASDDFPPVLPTARGRTRFAHRLEQFEQTLHAMNQIDRS